MSPRAALLAIAILLGGLLLLPALPILAEVAAFSAGQARVIAAFEAAFGPICHHIPERTPEIAGRALPVCARCVGLYLGWPIGLLGTGLLSPLLVEHPRRLGGALLALLGLGLIGFGAAIVEAVGGISTSNADRVVLGFLLGFGPAGLGALGVAALGVAASRVPGGAT